ncbi:DUF3658 domain-containing protein [Evtepia sp.]
MLEVVFDDSAAGSLRQALAGRYKVAEEGTVLFYCREEGEAPLSPEEEARLRAAERRWQQEEAQGWAESLPLPGQLRDILAFPLAHSVGEITEEGIGPQREAALRKVMGVCPALAAEATQTLLARGRASLEALLTRAGAGEAVRVWTGPGPDDACGLAWLAQTLRPLGLEEVSVTQVVLPDFWERPDGTVIRWNSWGEMEPWMWGRLAETGRRLPAGYLRGLAGTWQDLQKENAPLRAVVNGRLMSVPEDWYDPFLRREIAARPAEFSAAQVVGTVLGKYQLGIGDGELACRLEAMVQGGALQQVTRPGLEEPRYHCRLGKTPGVW